MNQMLKSQFQEITTKFPQPTTSLSQHHQPPVVSLSLPPLRPRAAPSPAAEELFPSIFETDDEPTPIVFIFRSLRQRARRRGRRSRSIDSLIAVVTSLAEAKGPPLPVQALLGAISAGVIALILYKFTTTIEAALNRQTISDNFSVRQITITIRTIIDGLCCLATFVFGINSVGLFLCAGQLAINSIVEEPKGNKAQTKRALQTTPVIAAKRIEARTIHSDKIRNKSKSRS